MTEDLKATCFQNQRPQSYRVSETNTSKLTDFTTKDLKTMWFHNRRPQSYLISKPKISKLPVFITKDLKANWFHNRRPQCYPFPERKTSKQLLQLVLVKQRPQIRYDGDICVYDRCLLHCKDYRGVQGLKVSGQANKIGMEVITDRHWSFVCRSVRSHSSRCL